MIARERHGAGAGRIALVTTWREQALIDAPVEQVWDLIGDPNRYPEWWPLAIEVEGLPRIETQATYRQVSRVLGATVETTFRIETLDDLREIKVVCNDFGTNARWLITPAQDATVADIEIGFESNRASLGVLRAPLAKRYLRTWAAETIGGLRGAVAHAGSLGNSAP